MKIVACCMLIFIFYVSCDSSKKYIKKIQVDSKTYAEGSIADDTIFNGLIKFTDKLSGKLIYQAFYTDGVLNGVKNDFNSNGYIKSSGTYEYGKLNGFVSFFDSLGKISEKQYYYYDILVGPRITYLNGNPFKYKFYSLDNTLLFEINYDLASGRRISELQENFFFLNNKYILDTENIKYQPMEYLLYCPNPPKYDFRYDLVKTDSSFNVLSVDQSFDQNEPMNSFTINKPSIRGFYALRLTIQDSINNERSTMFKRITLFNKL